MLNELLLLKDAKYAEFQCKLIPNIPRDSIIGVRTPQLKQMAKEMFRAGNADAFLNELPHAYFEENQLHAFILNQIKDFNLCITKTELFLPYVNNWATCDQLSPAVFAKHTDSLLPYIKKWIGTNNTYTVRFGICMLMRHYLDKNFDEAYPLIVSKIVSDEYYVNMMVAWYFATALAKQFDAVVPFVENRTLPAWTHKKTIQKACESYRLTDEQKEYLKTLR